MFESSVNSEGIETILAPRLLRPAFESSVNSEGIETEIIHNHHFDGLRAV